MKSTLTFDLTQDQHEFRCALNGRKYFDLIDEIRQKLRSLEKYENLTDEQMELVGKLREWLHVELCEAGISEDF